MPLLFVLQTAFSLWMLSDAIRRGAPQYWWLIILIPFGEWAYFFMVWLPRSQFRDFKGKLLTKPVSLKQLEYEYRTTPSVANRLRLAQHLHDRGDFDRAAALFGELIQGNPDDKEALLGYGLCCEHEGDIDEARGAFERLCGLDLGFRDFTACFRLAEIYWRADRRDDAVALFRRAAKKSQRLMVHAQLARYLADHGEPDEARRLLERGLDDFDNAPAYLRRQERATASRARALLRRL